MKTRALKALALAAMLLITPAVGCAGVKVRDELIPLAQAVWTDVRPDAVAGADGSAVVLGAVEVLDRALEAESRDQLIEVTWSVIGDSAKRGIAARETSGAIGPGVARVLVRRVDALGTLIERLKERLQ